MNLIDDLAEHLYKKDLICKEEESLNDAPEWVQKNYKKLSETAIEFINTTQSNN